MVAVLLGVGLLALVPVNTEVFVAIGRGIPPVNEFMFEPALSTLRAGFEAYRKPSVRFQWAVVEGNDTLRATAHLRRGDIFLWLGLHLSERVPWRALHDRGVRTIYYETEPIMTCRFRLEPVDEQWHYSWKNYEVCNSTRRTRPVLRYVPPGALSTPKSGHTTEEPALVFLGNPRMNLGLRGPKWKGRRIRCYAAIRSRLPPGRLVSVYNIWSEDAYAMMMTNYSMFLNIHKACGLPDTQLEAFRLAKLLNYGGIVFSERCHPLDEQAFHGLVSFMDVEHIAPAYLRLASVSVAERKFIAEARGAEFARRFDPAVLFSTAGVYAMLDRTVTEAASRHMGASTELDTTWRSNLTPNPGRPTGRTV